MARTTIHGWPVISASDCKDYKIAGTKRSIKLHKTLGAYLAAFAAEYHAKINPIDEGTFDDWGWSPLRSGRYTTSISDHCAGVAIDLNATKEGAASKSNVYWLKNPRKALALRALLKKYSLLEWGGDYRRHYDPMHFTFANGVTGQMVRNEIKRMGISPAGIIKK